MATSVVASPVVAVLAAAWGLPLTAIPYLSAISALLALSWLHIHCASHVKLLFWELGNDMVSAPVMPASAGPL